MTIRRAQESSYENRVFRPAWIDKGNETRAYQHVHTPLSALGRRQAECVARRFERIPVDLVMTSDMARATETGRCIAERNGFPMVVDPLFQEILRPATVRGKDRDAPEVLEIMRFLAEHWTNARVKHSDEENFFDLKTACAQSPGTSGGASGADIARRHARDLLVHVDLLHDGGGGGQSSMVRSRPSFVDLTIRPSACVRTIMRQWQLVSWNDHAHLG